MRHLLFPTKRIYIALCLLGCLLLSGCISPATFQEGSPSAAVPLELEVKFPGYAYDQAAARYYCGRYAAVCEDGYYLVINHVLHFYDIQTDTLFPLCTKESCLHKDRYCNAYIFDRSQMIDRELINGWFANMVYYKIYYDRQHMYMIGSRPDKGLVMSRYDPDFTERKEIVWLQDDEKAPDIQFRFGSILFYQSSLYYVTWLYQEDQVQNLEYETEYTAWRVSLGEKKEPEKLFTFNDLNTAGVKTAAVGDEIYFIVECESTDYIPDHERESEAMPYQVTGESYKVFRYQGEHGVELIWSYKGEEAVSLFEAEGAIPENLNSQEYIMDTEGDYVYLAGMPEYYDNNLMPTSIAAVNLKSREGKALYETPYRSIEQLRSDGEHYYFIETAKGYNYLTAIDREGKLIRRYEIPLDEKFIKQEEERGIRLKQTSGKKLSREEWGLGPLRLLAADGRYIVLGGFDGNTYKGLSSKMEGYDSFKYIFVDEGIGVIDAEDFISGKDVEIRQIYERTDPFN